MLWRDRQTVETAKKIGILRRQELRVFTSNLGINPETTVLFMIMNDRRNAE